MIDETLWMENSLWMIVDYVIIFEGIVKQFPEFLAVVLKKKIMIKCGNPCPLKLKEEAI